WPLPPSQSPPRLRVSYTPRSSCAARRSWTTAPPAPARGFEVVRAAAAGPNPKRSNLAQPLPRDSPNPDPTGPLEPRTLQHDATHEAATHDAATHEAPHAKPADFAYL